MVNKHEYNPSVKDIMDKYYEMFRGKNQVNTTVVPDRPEARTDGPLQRLQPAPLGPSNG